MNAQHGINWIEQGYVPDAIVRKGIRRLLKKRLVEVHANDAERASYCKQYLISNMKESAIALSTDKANEQHYEVPAKFYDLVLGDHNKYSCCYWDEKTESLSQAEEKALHNTCKHADLRDGQRILELGCGWGSLTLWMAERFPSSQITAVSNSSSQRDFIVNKAKHKHLTNINVITADMNDFNPSEQYDRVVSVEMFEHMRNWEVIFHRVYEWLYPDGKFFMHIFSHRQVPYTFEVKDSSDWMSEYFFTGGMMPCDDLPLYFQKHLNIQSSWTWSGEHYAHTSNAWLMQMD